MVKNPLIMVLQVWRIQLLLQGLNEELSLLRYEWRLLLLVDEAKPEKVNPCKQLDWV
jgi:hypothetical protein